MPWSRRKSRKLANRTSIALGFGAGISINLLTSWFQQDILSDLLLLFCIVIILVGIGLWVFRTRAALLIGCYVVLVVSVFFNLFSSWIQDRILRNSFTTESVTVILSITIILLVLSALIGSHPISRLERKLKRSQKRNTRARFAQEGRTPTRRPRKRIKKIK